MTEKEYYILDNHHREKGPFTKSQLKKMHLKPSSHVREKDAPTWQYARNIKGLVRKHPMQKLELLALILFTGIVLFLALAIYFHH